MRNNHQKQLLIGAAAAISVVFLWWGWVVVSRLGVNNNQTGFDVAGVLRGGVVRWSAEGYPVKNPQRNVDSKDRKPENEKNK